MAADTQLIPTRLRSTESFRRDLRGLLNLAPEHILALSQMAGESEAGFSSREQAPKLAKLASISSDEARRAILVAEYLYERCRDRGISAEHAVDELATLAEELGVEGIADRLPELRELVSVKQLYEKAGYVRSQAVTVLSHFVDLDGKWDIRPVFDRETGRVVTNLAVLLLTVSWHDQDGTSHSASFQMDQDEWAGLREEVDELENERTALLGYLEQL